MRYIPVKHLWIQGCTQACGYNVGIPLSHGPLSKLIWLLTYKIHSWYVNNGLQRLVVMKLTGGLHVAVSLSWTHEGQCLYIHWYQWSLPASHHHTHPGLETMPKLLYEFFNEAQKITLWPNWLPLGRVWVQNYQPTALSHFTPTISCLSNIAPLPPTQLTTTNSVAKHALG